MFHIMEGIGPEVGYPIVFAVAMTLGGLVARERADRKSTAKELSNLRDDIRQCLAEIARVGRSMATLVANFARIATTVAAHERRIGNLETKHEEAA